jgi:hypothetical protein
MAQVAGRPKLDLASRFGLEALDQFAGTTSNLDLIITFQKRNGHCHSVWKINWTVQTRLGEREREREREREMCECECMRKKKNVSYNM